MAFFTELGLGLFVGLISSFLGLGGGAIIVPLLPLVQPMTAQEAIATSLMVIFVNALQNTFRFAQKSLVDYKATFIMGPLSAITGFYSALWAQSLKSTTLLIILLVILFFVLYRTIAPIKFKTTGTWLARLFVGLLSGLVSGISGLGGGAISGPLMMAFTLVSDEKIVPTSNALMLFSSFAGLFAFVGFHSMASINWSAFTWGAIHLSSAVWILIGAWVSSTLGQKYQEKMKPWLRKILLVVILFTILVRVSWMLLHSA